MNKDNKILVLAIFIVLVAIFSFSFDDIITGKVTKESISKVMITPNEVMRGETITVEVIPGPDGTYNRWAWIYRAGAKNDLRLTGTAKRMCGTQSVCYEPVTFTYLISGDENKFPDGKYYVKVKEHDTQETKYAQNVFWIEGYNKK